jgi:hypothetical protein
MGVSTVAQYIQTVLGVFLPADTWKELGAKGGNHFDSCWAFFAFGFDLTIALLGVMCVMSDKGVPALSGGDRA